MSLLDRLGSDPNNEGKLPVHQFMAALAEYKRGAVSGAAVASGFSLSPTEATHLQEFLNELDTDAINRSKIHDVLLLWEGGQYNKTKTKLELGLTSG